MRGRRRASVMGLVLLIGLVLLGLTRPVPYVTMSPGPTIDVLGEADGRPIVRVRGEKVYPTEGRLRLTTVSVTRPENDVTLAAALGAWLDPDRALLPWDAVYGEESTNEAESAASAVQMVSSQDSAVAAALSALGYEFEARTEVLGVTADGPSDGTLKARDLILQVGATPIEEVQDVLDAVSGVEVGDEVTVVVRRDGRRRELTVTTGPAEDDPDKPVIGVVIGTGYEFPFDVSVRLDDSIGGPSAGLVFALSVYDHLTPGALTGGLDIAGTGTITAEGDVGSIGGIAQKIAAAEDDGVDLFLVPMGNCDAALEANVDEDKITLVRADTLTNAVEAIEAFVDGRDADLPRCAS